MTTQEKQILLEKIEELYITATSFTDSPVKTLQRVTQKISSLKNFIAHDVKTQSSIKDIILG